MFLLLQYQIRILVLFVFFLAVHYVLREFATWCRRRRNKFNLIFLNSSRQHRVQYFKLSHFEICLDGDNVDHEKSTYRGRNSENSSDFRIKKLKK